MEANLEMETQERGQKSQMLSITNRGQEIEERISGVGDTVEEIQNTRKS